MEGLSPPFKPQAGSKEQPLVTLSFVWSPALHVVLRQAVPYLPVPEQQQEQTDCIYLIIKFIYCLPPKGVQDSNFLTVAQCACWVIISISELQRRMLEQEASRNQKEEPADSEETHRSAALQKRFGRGNTKEGPPKQANGIWACSVGRECQLILGGRAEKWGRWNGTSWERVWLNESLPYHNVLPQVSIVHIRMFM